ncbi:MAG TPA: hypothetical protein VFD41_08355 [Actinomycetales bacterium]|nr:hypothetical protein [Actinomycetales bacterium]
MLESRPTPEVLRRALDAHRLTLEQGGPDVDRQAAAGVHVRLLSVLERWDHLAPGDQEDLADAIWYVARIDDDRNDIEDRGGLDDDAARVERVLSRLEG